MPSHTLYITISAFDIVAIATVIGALSCRLWVLPAETVEHFHGHLWRLLGLGLAALTASSLVLLVGRTLEMSRQPLAEAWHWLPLVVRETEFGHVWLIRPLVLLVMWTAWLVGRRSSRGGATGALMFLSVGIIAFTRSATGHPADLGPWTFPEWVDWAHLMVGSIWVGGLLAMTLCVFPTLPDPRIPVATRAALVKNLSTVAATALAGVLVTGLWGAYYYVGHWGNLWYSTYGHTLLVKVAFVLGAVALGALNRFTYVPKIRAAARHIAQTSSHPHSLATKTLRLLTRSVAIETILLFGALLTAAVLLHDMPPRDANQTMANGMAFIHQTHPALHGRFENVTVTTILKERNPPAISTVRYGVLDFPKRTTYSTGPSRLITDALSL